MPSQQHSSSPKARIETVPEDQAGRRLDNFLAQHLKGAPRSLIYRLVRRGEVRVNKGRAKPHRRLQPGDQVRIPPVRVAPPQAQADPGDKVLQRIGARIVFEDDQYLALDKPPGMAVHGGSGMRYGVIEALRALRPDAPFLELVHRLDRDTSGLLLIAKRRSALRVVHERLRAGEVDKRYFALLMGRMRRGKRTVEAPLRKNTMKSGERLVRVDAEGKEARSRFTLIEQLKGAALVNVGLDTGRTHQIRVHAQHMGHPLAGDPKYGDDEFNRWMTQCGLRRLFLVSQYLAFDGPDGRPYELSLELDDELSGVVENLR